MVVLRLPVVPRGRAIRLLATKGIPLRIAADREKGKASWCHVFSCAYACVYICVYVYIYVHFFCSECYMHFTGAVGTSAWAGVYDTQVCFNTNVHICDTLAAGCAHMCICMCMHICA